MQADALKSARLMAEALAGVNQVLTYLGLSLFAALPPSVLFARYRFGRSIPWWAVLALIAGVGWVLVNVTTYFYGQYVCEDFHPSEAPESTLHPCVADGARNVFALFFGWLYGLLYSVPWFLVFAVAFWIRRRREADPTHAV